MMRLKLTFNVYTAYPSSNLASGTQHFIKHFMCIVWYLLLVQNSTLSIGQGMRQWLSG